uniref:Putative secreted protein n=1 Tax=Panstrongylus lignarius TaxID=156445 RepID=A0A224Y3P2_9HEMI
MRAIILSVALIVMLAVFTKADNEPKFSIDLSETRSKGPYGSERRQTGRVEQDAWVSKDGNWRAGGYVQHDRYDRNGHRSKDTHGGIQVTGTF